LIVFLGAVAIASAVLLASARAAEGNTQKREPDDNLKKYDKNANGKLDPDEEAAMKADQEKAKRKKKD
jgi:hypothetical protein